MSSPQLYPFRQNYNQFLITDIASDGVQTITIWLFFLMKILMKIASEGRMDDSWRPAIVILIFLTFFFCCLVSLVSFFLSFFMAQFVVINYTKRLVLGVTPRLIAIPFFSLSFSLEEVSRKKKRQQISIFSALLTKKKPKKQKKNQMK